MSTLKNAGIGLVALIVLQSLWLETSHSQSPGSSKFTEEVSKQESIYQSKGEQVPAGYSVDRSLSDYAYGLSSAFDSTLANLGAKDRWLDIGAGTAKAVLDYYAPAYDQTHWEGLDRRGTKAQAVAMSIEDRRTPLWHQTAASLEPNKIRYVFDKRLREYSVGELGQFQLITDVIGGFSYTENLSTFVEKVLGFMELNGSFFTLLQDVHSENGANRPHYKDSPFLTQIANAEGAEVKICAWLKSISCVEVTCEFTDRWIPPIEAYHVRKVCNNVSVPALVTTHYAAGTPPERRYELRKPSPPPTGEISTVR